MVRDLFGNMPVRVKQRAIELQKESFAGKEWEELKKGVLRLLIAWPEDVAVSIINDGSGQRFRLRSPGVVEGRLLSPAGLISARKGVSMLHQASLISSPEWSNWVPVHAATSQILINGVISLDAAPTKALQYISIGIKPLASDHSFLYDEINRLFEKSSFGNEENLVDPEESLGAEVGQLPGRLLRLSKKGVDRWPMVILYISIPTGEVTGNTAPPGEHSRIGECILERVVELLQAMVNQFLTRHNFRPQRTETATGKPSDRPSSRQSPIERRRLGSLTHRADRVDVPLTSHFDGWSRVKSGRPKPSVKTTELIYSEESTEPAPSLSIAEYGTSTGLASGPPPLRTVRCAATVDRSGKVIRMPFGGLSEGVTRNPDVPMSILPEESISGSHQLSPDGDDVVLWRNPITKQDCRVNVKTGCVAQTRSGHVTPFAKTSEGTHRLTLRRRGEAKKGIRTHEESPWIDSILENWRNPVFAPAERAIPEFGLDEAFLEDQRPRTLRDYGFSSHPGYNLPAACDGLGNRITKSALKQADVVSQVDGKFILVKVPVCAKEPTLDRGGYNSLMLVLIDQHAADERCQVEGLLSELCSGLLSKKEAFNGAGELKERSLLLDKHIKFSIPQHEARLLQKYAQQFSEWGVSFDVLANESSDTSNEREVIIKRLPPVISGRCRAEPKLLIELLRTEAWKWNDGHTKPGSCLKSPRKAHTPDRGAGCEAHAWVQHIRGCPQGMLDMLNSRACRSAIMFNDALSNEECSDLVSRLSDTAFPFQCAHGRPSMVPLVELGDIDAGQRSLSDTVLKHSDRNAFGARYKSWKADLTRSGIS
jgi:DNA mismatch repair protein MLH3